jgi:chitodextrinase
MTATPATTHTYEAKTRDEAGNLSEPSNSANATTPPDTEAPSAPANLSATAVSSTQVELAWQAATDNVGVSAYLIYRDGILLSTVGSVSSYTDSTAASATTYSYTVKAQDAAGNMSDSSAAATASTP